MSKLTLHVPEDLVVAAKSEAAARKVSVSKLVSDYFRNLAAKGGQDSKSLDQNLAPRTSSLVGCISDPDIEDYVDYLEEKHS